MGSAGKACAHTMAADESKAGELALEPLLMCKLCLCEYSLDKMTTLQECSCIFCTSCLKQYMQLAIQEGCGSPITCPDVVCLNHGTLQEAEIACLVPVDQFQLYKRLKFERGKTRNVFHCPHFVKGTFFPASSNFLRSQTSRFGVDPYSHPPEVHLDPRRTWCPAVDCQAVCYIEPSESGQPVPVECPACRLKFCSSCEEPWHPERLCQGSQSALIPTEQGSLIKMEIESPIKQCPVCRIYIERNEGCAQMMCKNCKHTFCWYCLQNLDEKSMEMAGEQEVEVPQEDDLPDCYLAEMPDVYRPLHHQQLQCSVRNDIFLRHYDKGPCRNKLGHSRASVMWNRTQVVGILVGLGIIALVTSPLLLVASPCIICCICKSCQSKKKKHSPPTT